MKLPELSITRAKQLDVVGGALILCFLLLGKWPPASGSLRRYRFPR